MTKHTRRAHIVDSRQQCFVSDTVADVSVHIRLIVIKTPHDDEQQIPQQIFVYIYCHQKWMRRIIKISLQTLPSPVCVRSTPHSDREAPISVRCTISHRHFTSASTAHNLLLVLLNCTGKQHNFRWHFHARHFYSRQFILLPNLKFNEQSTKSQKRNPFCSCCVGWVWVIKCYI